MSVADLRRLVQRATPRVEDVRSPDRTDFVRRDHGHLPLRELVDAIDALQFSSTSFLRCFEELKELDAAVEASGTDADALVLTSEERLKRYCAAQPVAAMSKDTAVHQLYRLLSGMQILCPKVATETSEPTLAREWTEEPGPNWKADAADRKLKGSECFKQKDFQGVART